MENLKIDKEELRGIKKELKQKRIRQKEIAKRWNLDRSTITNKLLGNIPLSAEQYKDLKLLIKQEEIPLAKYAEPSYNPE